MKYLIDTNIFLRVLINEDEKSHAESVALIRQIKRNQLHALLPGLVLAELAWVLRSFYGFTRGETVKGVEAVVHIRGLEILERYDYQLALSLYKKFNVKFADACIATLAGPNRVIVSYDKDFDLLPVRRLEPKAVLQVVKT